jgi:3-oxoadipate CoA-transferase, alpha subunit
MIDKQVSSLDEAIEGIESGSTILVSGFGGAGLPIELMEAFLDHDVTDLTIIANNTGAGERGLAALLRERRIGKVICSYPRSKGSIWFERRYEAKEVQLEVVPQGTLTERIRAAGAGIGGFFTTTGVGTSYAVGKESRFLDGREYLLELPLRGDVALVKAKRADRWGNLVYHSTGRNYGPTMVAAATLSVVQVSEVVPLGSLEPEAIVTPGVLVDRVVEVKEARG